MNALLVKELVKKYKQVTALNGIDLSIEKGSICGILGPNGAGKSTLIKSLVGVVRPTSGVIKVLGLNSFQNRSKLARKIGYMPQYPALYEDLTARENIIFFGALHRVKSLEKKTDQILEFTELTERQHHLVYTFSGGMKKRVSLACALIHDPEILFLDEPTAAVDPHLKIKTWNLLRKLSEKGVTIIVSTHLMDEALLCDDLAVIYKGKILAFNSPEYILQYGNTHVHIETVKETIKKTISAKPQDLAKTLYKFGLNSSILSMKVTSESLETVILRILEEDKL